MKRPQHRRHPPCLLLNALVSMLMALPIAAHGASVVIDSPAWQALMARPATHEGLPAFYAADLLDTWGRPVEGGVLRRALLYRHLRAVAGHGGWTPATIGEVWQGTRVTPLTAGQLALAHEEALNHALVPAPDVSSLPAAHAKEDWKGAGGPGRWQRAGRIAAQVTLTNRSASRLAIGPLEWHVGAAGHAATLDCTPLRPLPMIDAQQATRWWCEGPGSPSALGELAHARWASTAMATDASLREVARMLGGDGAPLDFVAFVSRNKDCINQGTCPADAKRAAEHAAAAASAEAVARAEQKVSELEYLKKKRSSDRVVWFVLLAYVLGGLLAHLLVARVGGRFLATGVTLATGPAIGFWIFKNQGMDKDWGGLAMLIVLLMLCASGLPLAVGYGVIRKRFFGGP